MGGNIYDERRFASEVGLRGAVEQMRPIAVAAVAAAGVGRSAADAAAAADDSGAAVPFGGSGGGRRPRLRRHRVTKWAKKVA